jgi:hypothetical protein
MRGVMAAMIGLLGLPVTVPAQQVQLDVGWSVKIVGVTETAKIPAADLDVWREAQAKKYRDYLEDHLRFWRYELAPSSDKATLRFKLETYATEQPADVYGYAEVQLPGMRVARTVWPRIVVMNGSVLQSKIDAGVAAKTILADATARMYGEFFENDFRGHTSLFYQSAWVANGVLAPALPFDTVALPLPWCRLKESARSVFEIEDDSGPVLGHLEADGLGRPYRDATNKEYLQVKLRKPVPTLRARRVTVIKPDDGYEPDSQFDVVGP